MTAVKLWRQSCRQGNHSPPPMEPSGAFPDQDLEPVGPSQPGGDLILPSREIVYEYHSVPVLKDILECLPIAFDGELPTGKGFIFKAKGELVRDDWGDLPCHGDNQIDGEDGHDGGELMDVLGNP